MTGNDVGYWLYSKSDDLWCYLVRTHYDYHKACLLVKYSVYITYKLAELLSGMQRVVYFLKRISR